MCTSPITIKNRSKTCVVGVTRESIIVPCGKCDECRAAKTDEWFQRIYEEFLQCENHGGKVIFSTFTYDDDHLPRFHYVGDDGEDKSFPCFNKHHKIRYLNSFRKFFEEEFRRRNGVPQYSYPFKVMWCSEYGTDPEATHRSHYHILFFIPKEWIDLVGSLEPAWKRLIENFWHYGFVRWSPGNSIFVNSEFAGIYASKYLVKDVGFYKQPEVDEYMKDVKISLSDKKYLSVRDYLPHHWQSLKFGATLERIYSIKENFINGYDFRISSELSRGKQLKRKCPMYIQKRMLYDYNELGQMKLNDRGKEFKRDKFLVDVKRSVNRYLRYLDIDDLKAKIDNSDINDSEILRRFSSHDDIISYITEILTSLHNRHSGSCPIDEGVTEFVLWNSVWSGLWTYNREELSELDSLSFSDFLDASCSRYFKNLYISDEVDLFHPDGIFTVFNPGFDGAYYFDALSRFEGFTDVFKIIRECQSIYRIKCNKKYLEDREIRRRNKFLTNKIA
ncbi:MAG: hypothetical protein IJH65_11120 [Methanobrevibacter sp.]|nr:hypothetical protein [Methanobrevibacter sp.]